jgi:hygromycin-B 7''-O-kinase
MALLREFLNASDWPAGDDFAPKTLGLALYRQAVGLAQHHTFDVFHTLPALLPLQGIDTLDDLATELFAVM